MPGKAMQRGRWSVLDVFPWQSLSYPLDAMRDKETGISSLASRPLGSVQIEHKWRRKGSRSLVAGRQGAWKKRELGTRIHFGAVRRGGFWDE